MQWLFINWDNGLKIAMKLNKFILVAIVLTFTACSVPKTEQQGQVTETPPVETSQPATPVTPPPPRVTTPDAAYFSAQGMATIYPSQSHGSQTANGEIYDIYGMTAAMADLPFLARVEVFNPQTGRKAIVTINDRLGQGNGLIQMSYLAAKMLELQNNTPVVVRGLPAR